jgi:hypothetical protein
MINIHQLIDALPPVVGSMVTLWAVASPRHWFWRSWVVLAFLLLFLLIPAYELIIAGAAQTAVVVGGMLIWRYHQQRSETEKVSSERTQVSLRTILLFTVIFAAVMAVLGQFPDAPFLIWIRWMGPGITAGCVTLFAAWLVLGKTRLGFRVLMALILVLLTTAILAWMLTASRATRGWTEISWLTFKQVFTQPWLEKVAQRWLEYLPVLAIGFTAVATWTLLFRKTGWFNPFGEPVVSKPHWMWAYRVSWLWVTATISALPLYLFLNLINWSPLPADDLKPAYYAHFNAAGAMVSDADVQMFHLSHKLPSNILEARIKANTPAIERMRKGFEHLNEDGPLVVHDEEATVGLLTLANTRAELALRHNDPHDILDTRKDQLLCFHYLSIYYNVDRGIVSDFWQLKDRLDSKPLSDTIRLIAKLESEKLPWNEVQKTLLIDNAKEHWQNRLRSFIVKWYGRDPYELDRTWYHENRNIVRMMAIDMALYSFNKQKGHLPGTLIDLVPEFFDSLPIDPYSNGPFKYQIKGGQAIIYSVGKNGIDEQGKGDDMLFQPPVQQPATPSTP